MIPSAPAKQAGLPLWLVDAFTGEDCLGNPAGVCLVDDFPPAQTMQRLAFELHWSETAFVKPLGPSSFHIRWFAPEDEAPMCGHATLAAAHILFQECLVDGLTAHFHSCAGPLTVTRKVDEDGTWFSMDFPACPLISCTPSEYSLFQSLVDPCPIQELYKDSLLFVALLPSEEEARRCSPRLDLLAQQPCRALTITAPSSSPEFDFVSRYFAPKVGIPEDPVCGSAHCRLTPFWAQRLGVTQLKARQVSRRGGVLHVAYDSSANRVAISGQAKTILHGTVF